MNHNAIKALAEKLGRPTEAEGGPAPVAAYKCEIRSPGGRVCGRPADRIVWSILDTNPNRGGRHACKVCATVSRHVLTEVNPERGAK